MQVITTYNNVIVVILLENPLVEQEKGGLIVFPREYVVAPEPENSYLLGVDFHGRSIKAYIRPSPEVIQSVRSKSGATMPEISVFAEEGRRATNPCIAAPNNAPAAPEGVLLLEQTTEAPDGPHVEVVAKWASVLRDCSEYPVPLVGYGFVEIGFIPKETDTLISLCESYRETAQNISIPAIDREHSLSDLKRQILMERKKFYVGVVLKQKQMHSLESPNMNDIQGFLFWCFERYTHSGMYGGAILRARKNGLAIRALSAQCNMGFDYKKRQPKSHMSAFNDFVRFGGGKAIHEAIRSGCAIDIIPTQRINPGPQGVMAFDKQFDTTGVPKLLKTFVDKEAWADPFANYGRANQFLYSKIAIRPAVIKKGRPGAGNVLMSTAHSFSAPIANVLAIDGLGRPTYNIQD